MLIGRLGQDPKLAYLPSGSPVVNFTMATDESYRDRQSGEQVERTEWHRITVYGRQAETCANYLSKGSLVYVEGSLRTRKWQAQDGSDRYTTEVIAQRVQFMDSRPKGDQAQGQQRQSRGGGRQQPQQDRQDYDDDMGPAFPSEASGMDDVPF
jgi:single-strand DNA-binding protein